MLETKMVESFSMVMIYTYSLFILFDLTVSDSLAIDPNLTALIDSIFLTFFFIEIGLKTFASSGMFLTDFFNFFDAAIVLTSEIFNLLGITAKGLGVLRLIRVVVLTIRRITGNTSKLRHQNKNLNPVDSVIKILQQMQDLPEISKSVQKEAVFAIHLIESNMLYNLNMDQSSEEKNMDMEAKAWLNMTTESANDTTTWFERDLDDFLRELHREAEEPDVQQLEEDDERLR